MTVIHRISRLERVAGTLLAGRKRCSVCKDGTLSTGVLITFEGLEPSPRPAPCSGCGRDEPTIINYRLAVPPERALAGQSANL